MKTTVLFFGPLAEITGQAAMEVEGYADTDALKQGIERQFPGLSERTYALALNKTLLRAPAPLTEGATLAFLPPFSGG